jgi:hypothetical protein
MLTHNLDLYAIEKQTHMKVGVLVRSTLTKMLEENMISESEIAKMQTETYSKKVFDIQYPLLLNAKGINKKPLRYWAKPVKTHGEYYYICSEWYESSNNDDRSYFLAWLKQFRQ